MATIKKISELEQLEVLSDSSNIIVEENGRAKKFSAKNIGAVKTDNLVYNNISYNGQMTDSTSWLDVCYGNGVFVAVECDSCCGIAYSSDGINWTQASGIDEAAMWNSVCYGDEKFVAISYNNKIAYSLDGVVWAEVELPECLNGTYVSICYGDGKFVAIAESEAFAVYSTDGINWETTEFRSDAYRSVCYGGGKFVAVGSGCPATLSEDGINWETYDLPFDSVWGSVCYGNGKFVMADYDGSGYGAILYSIDGINWNVSEDLNADNCWRACYCYDKFIAFSCDDENTYMAVSTDGINWAVSTTLDGTIYLNSICYGDGKYVAVCEGTYSDKSFISFDGATWGIGESGYISQDGKDVTTELRDLLGGGDAVDLSNVVQYSDDYSIDMQEHCLYNLSHIRIGTYGNGYSICTDSNIYNEDTDEFCAVAEFYGDNDENIILRRIADGVNDLDAVNLRQMNTAITQAIDTMNTAITQAIGTAIGGSY